MSNLFTVYQQATNALGYPQELQPNDSIWVYASIDELSGLIALTDSEANMPAFFAECDRIEQTIKSLGYEL